MPQTQSEIERLEPLELDSGSRPNPRAGKVWLGFRFSEIGAFVSALLEGF